jgi:hypothetical protein
VNRNYSSKTLENKENDNEKSSYLFGRIFGNISCEKPNVKMGKRGGGGHYGVER